MLEHTKGQGNLIFGKSVIWVCKRDKGLTDEFYSFIKTVHLQQFKGIQISKQGMWKGGHLCNSRDMIPLTPIRKFK